MSEIRVFDPSLAQAALEKLRSELEALDGKQIDLLNVDLQDAALVVLDVADFCSFAEVRQLFESMPKEFFDIAHLNRLVDLGWCAWLTQNEFLTASSSATQARLPAELVERSTERRNRMVRVTDYYLGNDPVDGPEVASIKAGSGYKDTANDLIRLARLYRLRMERLSRDFENYRVDDEEEARKDAAEILQYYRTSDSTAAKWADMKARAWTLMRKSYEEVAATGQYIFRHDARKDRFPSLYTATRKPRRSGPEKRGPSGEPT